jgi:hypothetical protein
MPPSAVDALAELRAYHIKMPMNASLRATATLARYMP